MIARLAQPAVAAKARLEQHAFSIRLLHDGNGAVDHAGMAHPAEIDSFITSRITLIDGG